MVFPGFSPGEQSPINRGTATKPPGCWHSWQRTVCTTKKARKVNKKAKRKWKKIENKSEEAPRVLTPLTTQCFVPIKIPSTNRNHLCLLLHTPFPMIIGHCMCLKKGVVKTKRTFSIHEMFKTLRPNKKLWKNILEIMHTFHAWKVGKQMQKLVRKQLLSLIQLL